MTGKAKRNRAFWRSPKGHTHLDVLGDWDSLWGTGLGKGWGGGGTFCWFFFWGIPKMFGFVLVLLQNRYLKKKEEKNRK